MFYQLKPKLIQKIVAWYMMVRIYKRAYLTIHQSGEFEYWDLFCDGHPGDWFNDAPLCSIYTNTINHQIFVKYTETRWKRFDHLPDVEEK